MSDRPPNILLIVADQLAADALPAYGNRVVRAPALAELAGRSTVFETAYCASPLCAPARAALLGGRRASTLGVYDNGAELPASVPTVAHVLRAAGYRTALAGKMHFIGPDQLHGYEQRLTTDIYPASLVWTPDWSLPEGERLPWYHGTESVRRTRVAESAIQTDYDDEVAFQTTRFLRDVTADDDGRPFFLTASFTNPHDPWEVRRRHWDLYDGVDVGRPAVPPLPRRQADPHSLRLRDMCLFDADPLTEDEVAIARRGYLAAVSYLDERVGELLDVLDATGQSGDTVVVFTADHGEMLGERGLWYKMSFFEPSVRVPLLVSTAGGVHGREARPVSHLDLAPTLARLAGAGPLAEWEGADLAAPPADRAVVSEYLAEGVVAPAVMLRRGALKYVRCDGDPEQLYDLAGDPLELQNLAEGESHRAELLELRAESERQWQLDVLAERIRASQHRRRLVHAALTSGAYTPWDHQPESDASLLYVRDEAAGRPRPSTSRPRGGLP